MPSHQLTGTAYTLSTSRHAEVRRAQRGISSDLIHLLLSRGSEIPCGGGSTAVVISHETARELGSEGLRPAQVDRLRRLRAIVASDGALVTVMHGYSRSRSASRRAGVDR